MKSVRSLTIAAILALVVAVVPAAASEPQDVTIVSEMTLSTSSGSFVAYGPAVDAGILCPTGDVYDVSLRATGWQSGRFVLLFVHKVFVCADGSGTFEMNLNVRLAADTTAKWIVTGGDGPYAHLFGNGDLFATFLTEDILIDTYTGRIHTE